MAFDLGAPDDEFLGPIFLRAEIDLYDPGEWPSIFVQTGHKRTGPVALVQDPDILRQVTIYNYDNTIPEFAEYCARRGVPMQNRNEAEDDLVHAGKTQDCWELWLRKLGLLPDEVFKEPGSKNTADREYRKHKIIKSIYT